MAKVKLEPANLFYRLDGCKTTDKGLAEAHEAGRQLKATGTTFDWPIQSILSKATFTLWMLVLNELNAAASSQGLAVK